MVFRESSASCHQAPELGHSDACASIDDMRMVSDFNSEADGLNLLDVSWTSGNWDMEGPTGAIIHEDIGSVYSGYSSLSFESAFNKLNDEKEGDGDEVLIGLCGSHSVVDDLHARVRNLSIAGETDKREISERNSNDPTPDDHGEVEYKKHFDLAMSSKKQSIRSDSNSCQSRIEVDQSIPNPFFHQTDRINFPDWELVFKPMDFYVENSSDALKIKDSFSLTEDKVGSMELGQLGPFSRLTPSNPIKSIKARTRRSFDRILEKEESLAFLTTPSAKKDCNQKSYKGPRGTFPENIEEAVNEDVDNNEERYYCMADYFVASMKDMT